MLKHQMKFALMSPLRTTALFLLSLSLSSPASSQPLWEPVSYGLDDSRLHLVAVDPQVPRTLYAASLRAVYRSDDGGRHWSQRFRTSGHAEVMFLAVDPFDGPHALVATTRGLYATADDGRHWLRAFRGGTSEEARCHVVFFHPFRRGEVWLGTAGGGFVSRDGGRSWQSAGPELSRRSIRYLAIDPTPPHRLYVLTDHEVFAGGTDEATWQSLFSLAATPQPLEEAAEQADEAVVDETASADQLTALAVDPALKDGVSPSSPTTLYLSSLNGAYTSADGGVTWLPLTQLGLGTASIRHLILHHHSPTVLYAATPNGVARLLPEEQRWEALYAGLPTKAARFLAATDSRLFAATDQGLYMLDLTMEQLAQGNWPGAKALLGDFVHEPSIGAVQENAIHYAEVQPEKIAAWRKQARMSALIPKFTVTGDTNLTDFRHWDSGANPDALQKGERDIDWSTNVTWELGDFIYSDDQTNIDVRSKLMVELRDSILDDVTRSYFERRRLQVELITDPPTEPKAQLAKELRIQELTAILDGLTGGWFSSEIERNGRR